jgi:hypothetical protein
MNTGFGGERLGRPAIARLAGGNVIARRFQGFRNGRADPARAACDECNPGHDFLPIRFAQVMLLLKRIDHTQ